MELLEIIELGQALTDLLRNKLTGGAEKSAENALLIESTALKLIAGYQSEAGKPMDLSKLQQVPVDEDQAS